MAHTHPAEALFAELRDLVAAQLAESGTPGAGYGVVADGEVFAAGSGIIGVEDPREVTADTLFQLCSVTKPMTAALALGLVEDGLLGLDEPVAGYLPELALANKGTRDRLTLRHLLTHTSGLAGEWPGDLAEYGAGDDALARLIADYPQLIQYAPLGAHWGYCNPGYWLAGRLIEAVTGIGFETAMRERLLTPLGMSETTFRSEETAHRDVALPHNPGAENGQTPVPDFSFPRARTASGGVLASARDVLRFAAAALGTPLPGSESAISENVRAAMMQALVPAEGAGVHQSLGWQVRLTEAGPIVSHGGSYTGYATNLILAPTRGIAAVVLTNSDSGHKLCRDTWSLFARRTLDWQEPEPTFVVPAAQILDRYPGRYAHPEADHVLVSRVESGVRIDVAKRNGEIVGGDCRAVSDTEFAVAGGPLEGLTITFLPELADETVPTNLIRVALRIGSRVS